MKLTKIILETKDIEADIVDDILSSLNENDTNSIISKMKTYARRGLLTLAIVTAVTQGMEARDISTAEINRVNQVGTELVDKFEQSEDRITVRAKETLEKLLSKRELRKLIKRAEKEDAYIGVGASRIRKVSSDKASLDSIRARNIKGKVQPKVLETKFYKLGRDIITVKIVKFN